MNTGSFASVRFSLDYHPLTIIEVDGTLVEPYTVSGLVIAVAQRYSVLIHTNQTSEPSGNYWMRTALQTDMFTYDQPGQNVDIRGIVRYGDDQHTLPTATDDPGVPSQKLDDMDSSLLVPAVTAKPPTRTKSVRRTYTFLITNTVSVRMYTVSISLENDPENHFLAFMNSTSWVPLKGTTTLLDVYNNKGTYAPNGGSIQPTDQFMITEDDIQVVDLLIVSSCFIFHDQSMLTTSAKNNLDDGDHPFHLHGHRPYM